MLIIYFNLETRSKNHSKSQAVIQTAIKADVNKKVHS